MNQKEIIIGENKRTKDTLKEKLRLILISVFVISIFMRDIFGVPITSNVFIGISVLFFIISDISSLLAFLVFLIPLRTGIPGSFIMLIAFIMYIFKNNSFNLNYGILSVFIITIIELLNSLGTNDSLYIFTRNMMALFFVVLVLTDSKEKYDYNKIVKYYIYGYFWTCLDIIFQTLRQFNIFEFINRGIRFGNTSNYIDSDRMGGIVSPNVNALGVYSVMAITFILVLMILDKKNYKLIPVLIFAGMVGFLTYSRTFILSLGITLILYVILSFKLNKNIIKNLLLVSVTVGGFVIILVTKFSNVFLFMISRFQVDDITNGRINIANFYNNYLLTHPKAMLMGVGLQNYESKVGYTMSVHNGVQEVLISWGIVGIFCVILFFYSIYINAIRHTKSKDRYPFAIIPGLVFIISIQASRLFSGGIQLLMIIPCYSIIRLSILYKNNTKGSEHR